MLVIGLSMALLGLLAVWMGVLAAFRRPLCALWREPVLRVPVVILESDDWGAGPPEQVAALLRLRDLLAATRNAHGESIVMTVGVILATIDRDASRTAGQHVAVTLAAPTQAAVRDALTDGERTGVFALQLHGLTHYWPDSLLARARQDDAVAGWLAEPGVGWTETLPSALQSHWIDATTLPSTALPEAAVQQAVAGEVATWRECFGALPRVAVPTTFVWTPAVERALSAAGLDVLVTPGLRFDARGADGAPSGAGAPIRNGERGAGGLLLLVRDLYFEPVLGHAPERLADGVCAHARLGRPALIEMHRFNFCGPRASATAFDTLRDALADLLVRVPAARFMSTAALADILARRDEAFVERSFTRRLATWARRARDLRGFHRWARVTGLGLPLRALESLA